MPLREYHQPRDRESAASLLRRKHTITKPIFLGPHPIALHEQDWEAAVDISQLGLDFIERDTEGGFSIGALTPLQDIVTSEDLQQYAGGLLPRATRLAAHIGIRNAANLGGVFTTTLGAPELRLALTVLDAETIFEDGFIAEVRLPAQTTLTSLQRVGRTPMDEAIIAVAVGLQCKENVVSQARIAVSGISHSPLRIESAEALLRTQALTPDLIDAVADAAMTASDPAHSDYRGSATYRRQMAAVLTRRAVEMAWQQEQNK